MGFYILSKVLLLVLITGILAQNWSYQDDLDLLGYRIHAHQVRNGRSQLDDFQKTRLIVKQPL